MKNSTAENSVHVSQVPVTLFRFEHPDQWMSRPKWRPSIDPTSHKPKSIVGGYHLAKDLWQACGLCGQNHLRGYVIATEDNLETHIGKDCGQRHFGVMFEEIERQFTVMLDAQDREQRLRDLIAGKAVLLSEVENSANACRDARLKVSKIISDLEKEPELSSAFRQAQVDQGSLIIEVRASENEYQITKERFRRERMGRIDGIEVVTSKSPENQLRSEIIPFLVDLTPEVLAGLTRRQLEEKSKIVDKTTSVLGEAQGYLRLVERFLDTRNWVAFQSLFRDGLRRASDRGHRILKRLTAENISSNALHISVNS